MVPMIDPLCNETEMSDLRKNNPILTPPVSLLKSEVRVENNMNELDFFFNYFKADMLQTGCLFVI